MSLSLELVFAIIILIPFITVNILFGIGVFFKKITSLFLQKALKLDESVKNSKNKILDIINFIVWVSIGLFFIFTLETIISFSSILVFLAFRGGFSLSKRFVFGIHDIKVAKSKIANKKITRIIFRAISYSTFIELLFLLIWGILYRYLSLSVKSIFGIEVNFLIILLWSTGFLYGMIISLIQSMFSKDILLKKEIGILLLFSGQLLKHRVKESIFKGKK